MHSIVPLTALAQELSALTGRKPPHYMTLYFAVTSGRIPAERFGGRWVVDRSDLPAIAEKMGLASKLHRGAGSK